MSAPSTEAIATTVSVASICIATVSLAWNIYRDVFMRPRTIASAMVGTILQGEIEEGPFIIMRIANGGPGKIVITNIVLRKGGFLRALIGTVRRAVVMYDYENPWNPRLPMEVPEVEVRSQYLRFQNEHRLPAKVSRFGFIDTMNRYHWIKRRDLRDIMRTYIRDFGSAPPETEDD